MNKRLLFSAIIALGAFGISTPLHAKSLDINNSFTVAMSAPTAHLSAVDRNFRAQVRNYISQEHSFVGDENLLQEPTPVARYIPQTQPAKTKAHSYNKQQELLAEQKKMYEPVKTIDNTKHYTTAQNTPVTTAKEHSDALRIQGFAPKRERRLPINLLAHAQPTVKKPTEQEVALTPATTTAPYPIQVSYHNADKQQEYNNATHDIIASAPKAPVILKKERSHVAFVDTQDTDIAPYIQLAQPKEHKVIAEAQVDDPAPIEFAENHNKQVIELLDTQLIISRDSVTNTIKVHRPSENIPQLAAQQQPKATDIPAKNAYKQIARAAIEPQRPKVILPPTAPQHIAAIDPYADYNRYVRNKLLERERARATTPHTQAAPTVLAARPTTLKPKYQVANTQHQPTIAAFTPANTIVDNLKLKPSLQVASKQPTEPFTPKIVAPRKVIALATPPNAIEPITIAKKEGLAIPQELEKKPAAPLSVAQNDLELDQKMQHLKSLIDNKYNNSKNLNQNVKIEITAQNLAATPVPTATPKVEQAPLELAEVAPAFNPPVKAVNSNIDAIRKYVKSNDKPFTPKIVPSKTLVVAQKNKETQPIKRESLAQNIDETPKLVAAIPVRKPYRAAPIANIVEHKSLAASVINDTPTIKPRVPEVSLSQAKKRPKAFSLLDRHYKAKLDEERANISFKEMEKKAGGFLSVTQEDGDVEYTHIKRRISRYNSSIEPENEESESTPDEEYIEEALEFDEQSFIPVPSSKPAMTHAAIEPKTQELHKVSTAQQPKPKSYVTLTDESTFVPAKEDAKEVKPIDKGFVRVKDIKEVKPEIRSLITVEPKETSSTAEPYRSPYNVTMYADEVTDTQRIGQEFFSNDSPVSLYYNKKEDVTNSLFDSEFPQQRTTHKAFIETTQTITPTLKLRVMSGVEADNLGNATPVFGSDLSYEADKDLNLYIKSERGLSDLHAEPSNHIQAGIRWKF